MRHWSMPGSYRVADWLWLLVPILALRLGHGVGRLKMRRPLLARITFGRRAVEDLPWGGFP
jgi:hypothetical protein